MSAPEPTAADLGAVTCIAFALPWPPRTLHPNARAHWGDKTVATKAARIEAWAEAIKAGAATLRGHTGRLKVHLCFHPPDRRRRDLDGCFASMKAALDGISDATGIDDRRFGFALEMGLPDDTGGSVWVQIIPEAAR